MVPFERALMSSYISPPLNFSSVFMHLRDIAAFVLQHATFSYPTSSLLKIFPCSWSKWMAFGLRRVKVLSYLRVQIVSKISNLCGPDAPTLQTDGRTDDMQSQYRALHYSALRGKNWYR